MTCGMEQLPERSSSTARLTTRARRAAYVLGRGDGRQRHAGVSWESTPSSCPS